MIIRYIHMHTQNKMYVKILVCTIAKGLKNKIHLFCCDDDSLAKRVGKYA